MCDEPIASGSITAPPQPRIASPLIAHSPQLHSVALPLPRLCASHIVINGLPVPRSTLSRFFHADTENLLLGCMPHLPHGHTHRLHRASAENHSDPGKSTLGTILLHDEQVRAARHSTRQRRSRTLRLSHCEGTKRTLESDLPQPVHVAVCSLHHVHHTPSPDAPSGNAYGQSNRSHPQQRRSASRPRTRALSFPSSSAVPRSAERESAGLFCLPARGVECESANCAAVDEAGPDMIAFLTADGVERSASRSLAAVDASAGEGV